MARRLVACILLIAVSSLMLVMCKAAPQPPPPMSPQMEQVLQTCRDRTKVNEQQMHTFMMNGMNEQEATEPLKCHIACIMELNGDLKDGVFNADAVANVMKSMPPLKGRSADIDTVVGKCKDVKGTGDCDTAYKIAKCFKEQRLAAQ